MSAIDVAPIRPGQYESLVDLLLELHAYYIDPPTATRASVRAHLTENLLADSPSLCMLAASRKDDEVLGFAALHLQYSLVEPSPDTRRQCVLKELYVRSSTRSLGVGELLVRGAARFAIDNGCGRMDWNVKASNLRGIDFYKSLGGSQVQDRLSFRLSRKDLEALASVA
jgi:ribosomal protein S18 acetylase RimI-like enzyme